MVSAVEWEGSVSFRQSLLRTPRGQRFLARVFASQPWCMTHVVRELAVTCGGLKPAILAWSELEVLHCEQATGLVVAQQKLV
jgi:hypothetical protein